MISLLTLVSVPAYSQTYSATIVYSLGATKVGNFIYELCFYDINTVSAVGLQNGNSFSYLYSTNAGNTWTTAANTGFRTIKCTRPTQSSSIMSVIAAGSSVFTGSALPLSTWVKKFDPAYFCIDITHGPNGNTYLVGYQNVVAKSTSATYATWTNVLLPLNSVGDGILYGVSTYDGVKVIIVGGAGRIFYSFDGLASLSVANSLADASTSIYNIIHLGPDTAIAAGTNGYLARTINGGSTWERKTAVFSSPYGTFWKTLVSVSATEVFIAVTSGILKDVVLHRSVDAGVSFSQVLAIPNADVYNNQTSLAFFDATYGLLQAGKNVYSIYPSRKHTYCPCFSIY